jgi:hypothetical protein
MVGAIMGAMIGAFVQYLVMRHQIRTKYSLAAIERRLNNHQSAYDLCYEFSSNMHEQDHIKRGEVNDYFEKWWVTHCIFLGLNSRVEINKLANMYFKYDPQQHNTNDMKKLSEQIKQTAKCILDEVQLPPVKLDLKLFEK